jgi:hypothetical protein
MPSRCRATAAAAQDVPSYRIQAHTLAAEMVQRYVREADKWTNGGLKGVWPGAGRG